MFMENVTLEALPSPRFSSLAVKSMLVSPCATDIASADGVVKVATKIGCPGATMIWPVVVCDNGSGVSVPVAVIFSVMVLTPPAVAVSFTLIDLSSLAGSVKLALPLYTVWLESEVMLNVMGKSPVLFIVRFPSTTCSLTSADTGVNEDGLLVQLRSYWTDLFTELLTPIFPALSLAHNLRLYMISASGVKFV